jgi:hypothetical protein
MYPVFPFLCPYSYIFRHKEICFLCWSLWVIIVSSEGVTGPCKVPILEDQEFCSQDVHIKQYEMDGGGGEVALMGEMSNAYHFSRKFWR